MALVSSILAAQLSAMTPTDNEAQAILNFASAWEAYFYGASLAGIVAVPGTLAGATELLKANLIGWTTDSTAPAKIQAAITAFWGAVSAASPAIWIVPGFVVAPAIPPVGLALLSSAIQGVFTANTTANSDLFTAANNLATTLHGSGGLGGTVVLTPPLPATPVTTPIL